MEELVFSSQLHSFTEDGNKEHLVLLHPSTIKPYSSQMVHILQMHLYIFVLSGSHSFQSLLNV